MSITEVNITGQTLTIEEVVAVAYNRARVLPLSQETKDRMLASHEWLDDAITNNGAVFYGINTGFGAHANVAIKPEQAGQLSRNVVLADVAGVGNPLPKEVVRATMLIRANAISTGHSAIRPLVVEQFIKMLNKDVIPFVPEKGSCGASGDLLPLSSIAVVATCDSDGGGYSGKAWYQGELMTGHEAMEKAGIPPIQLIFKEGNSMINGPSFIAAMGCLGIERCENLISHAEIAAALSMEALLAVSSAYHPSTHGASKQTGQARVAGNLRQLFEGSQLLDSTDKVQDAYCLRCTPQVLGPVRDTIAFVRGYIERTLNASIDNPLIFKQETNDYISLSGGNFHGEGLAFMMDFLSIVMSEVANISDRRSFALLTPSLNCGLPSMLIQADGGLNTGLMVAQYAGAALVSDNKTLAHPDSVDSIPTSADQEDHVSMGANGARHMWEILENVTHVLAIELLCASQALGFRENANNRLGIGTKAAYEGIRKVVDFFEADKELSPAIATLAKLIKSQEMSAVVIGTVTLEN